MAFIATIKLLFNSSSPAEAGEALGARLQDLPDLLDWQYTGCNPIAPVKIPEGYQGHGDDFPAASNTHKQTVYLLAYTESGRYTVATGDLSQVYPSDYVLMSQQDVEFVVKGDDAVVQAQLDGIEKAQQKLKADFHVAMRKLDERKQSLLAIGHQPTQGVPVSEYEGLAG